ncbi:3-oxoadipate enol-lactonase [Chelatococcus daeguensis]|uniref:3-oxoadipate enol-lactonase n=1 Tax=Chelatococcus daeguensis TaxID=444444 RepID=UPI0007AB804F|nr:3-oxoadipate enol-lactonase [Chelatococcus daeguensis]KZE28443.1 3-oxoadipate enol-lactonase [Chelatococcus daeguensis]MBM3083393.1 3-oxoadipate enol-lactonase [Chelatococcus daeguensis]
MTIIDIAGEPFNVRMDGPKDAPVLMLSNSLSSNMSMWDAQVRAWQSHFCILRYDSRGHGASVAPDRPYSIAELGRDAVAILDHFGIAKAHWCGVSKGGMVGMWLMTHAPERLGRVVLANTSAHMGPPELWNGRIRTARRAGMAALADATVERWFTTGFRERAPQTIAAMHEMIVTTPAHGYAGCCAAIRDMDQRWEIRAAKNPLLVVVGAHDPATPLAAGRQIHEAIAGSSLVILEAAHISNVEAEAAFNQVAGDFLRG